MSARNIVDGAGPRPAAPFSPPPLRGRGRGRGVLRAPANLVAAVLVLALSLPAAGCGRAEGAPAEPVRTGLPADAPAAEAPASAFADREPGGLRTVASDTVIGRTGPGGKPFEVALRSPGEATHLTRPFGTRSFDLGLRVRQRDLGQYPCASCHVGTGFTPDVDRVADAHQDVQPTHPRETGATCVTCHATEDVSRLALGSGERATLDHAYRLCAQCHSPQVEAWAAGAHGKRLDGWQGRRVVMGCADCHDPHHPATEKRIPFDPPRIARTGGRD
jgi:hypothetical protein